MKFLLSLYSTMDVDFSNINYLRKGNSRQRRAFELLSSSGIFIHLRPYHPLLAGTLPIGIETSSSDLDIVCQTTDRTAFTSVVAKHYGHMPFFETEEDESRSAVICRFMLEEMEIELYASPIPPLKSNAFIHMMVENKILNFAPEGFRGKIIALKKSGMKTEPAFAYLLGLEGNPYDEILKLEKFSDIELEKITKAIRSFDFL